MIDAQRHLTMLIPGLLGPAVAAGHERTRAARTLCEGIVAPALERLLSRAARHAARLEDDSPEALAFASFGVARDGPDWPVAAMTYLHDGGEPGGEWLLRADPVHLRADLGHATIFDAQELDLSPADEADLAAEIGEHLRERGLVLEARGRARWYLRGSGPQRLETTPLSVVAGTSAGERLPRGDDAQSWNVLGNDIQMILHASPVNRRREARGQPAVNGLWLWGGGRLPEVPARRYATVWSSHPLLGGLARASGAALAPAPRDAAEWLARAPEGGEHLIELMAIDAPVRRRRVEAWREIVERLEPAWAAPLLAALESRRIASVTLRTGAGGDFRLTRRALGRWWRRGRSIAELAAAP